MSNEEKVVIIGGVAAGMSAASKAKRTNPNLKIKVFEKLSFVSYGSCGLPYYISGVVTDYRKLIARTPEDFAKRDIEVYIRHEVVEIDTMKRRVKVVNLEEGKEFYADYDKLLIATGAKATKFPIPGIDLRNIFALRNIEDGIAIRDFIERERPRRAIIVGAGYIGLEMAESFKTVGMEVTVVEKAPRVMLNFDPDMSELIREEIQNKGAEVVTSAGVKSFEGDSSGVVRRVTTEDGEFEADIVLLAMGIRSEVSLAKEARIDIGPAGAIAVDEKMKTSSHSIYAAGDCVEVKNIITLHSNYIPLGSTANKQGRTAGDNIAGGHSTFKGVVGTAVCKIFDLQAARTGLTEEEANKLGYEVETSKIKATDRAGYYPGVTPLHIKYIYDKKGGKLLGGQIIGEQGAAKRIDVLATALYNQMTIEQIAELDLSYAPPYASALDALTIAANVAMR